MVSSPIRTSFTTSRTILCRSVILSVSAAPRRRARNAVRFSAKRRKAARSLAWSAIGRYTSQRFISVFGNRINNMAQQSDGDLTILERFYPWLETPRVAYSQLAAVTNKQQNSSQLNSESVECRESLTGQDAFVHHWQTPKAVESFHGNLREECLRVSWFRTFFRRTHQDRRLGGSGRISRRR